MCFHRRQLLEFGAHVEPARVEAGANLVQMVANEGGIKHGEG
jgi:hypothetical protein